MPLPEGYLPIENDVLLIRVKVSYDVGPSESDVHVKVIGQEYKKLIVPLAEIHALHLRAWNLGDKVSFEKFTGPGEVIAVHGDQVWVKTLEDHDENFQTAGCMYTADANDLKPWVEPTVNIPTDLAEEITLDEIKARFGRGAIGSQSIVGYGDPIAARDEAANR